MNYPEGLQYTAEHEWLRIDGEVAEVGITSYAAEQLGDVVYVDLPEVGRVFAAGDVLGEIESTKSVGELFAPASGTVLEVNQAVADTPELVNSDPFGAGWLVRLQLSGAVEAMTAEAYRAQLS